MRIAPFHPAYAALTGALAPRAQIWRILVGFALAVAVAAAVVVGLFAAVGYAVSRAGRAVDVAGLAAADAPGPTLLVLASFVGPVLGVAAVLRLLHGRRIAAIAGPGRAVLRDFAVATAVSGAVFAIALGAWFALNDSVPGLEPSLWAALLPAALLTLLVQTGAEELLFRGYLQGHLAARFRMPLVWLALPALVFGAAHYDPISAGDKAWLVVGSATLFGLIAADLTAATGTLGAAWGLHFANNTVAVVILGTQGTITGLALRMTPYSLSEAELSPLLVAGDAATILLAWAAVRVALRR